MMNGLTPNDKFWFQVDESEIPDYITATINELVARQDYKRQDELRHFKLYSNQNTQGFRVADYTMPSTNNGLVFNVVQNITDTIVSKIGKNKPKITFLTDKGDWQLKRRAENLETFIEGQFYRSKVYDTSPRVLKRACVFGSGLSKIYTMDGEICNENVFPGEIWVDDREAIDGNTKTLYQLKFVSKELLKVQYPEFEREISEAGEQEFSRNWFTQESFYRNSQIPVVEAWRLPSRRGGNDGRHVISISNKALLDEKWSKNYFPFAHLKFSEKLLGFWGVGVAEILTGIQLEINKTIKRIQQSIHINAVPRIFYEYSSKIVKEHFSNDVGSMVGYRGTPPIISVSPSVSADVFSHLDRLYQKAFEIIGVSQMSAVSQKPAGLNAAVALREFHDVETERFATLQNEYDNYHLEVAKQFIDCAKELAASNKNYSVISKTQGGAIKLKWKDVHLEEDSYIMQMYPTSLLPQQPAGRLEKVIELINAGVFTKEEGTSLLDFPDVKAVTMLKTARTDDIMLTISKMIETGDYYRPQEYQDLQAGINYCQSFYLLYKHQEVPQDKLDLLLRWISDAQKMLTPPAMLPTQPGANPTTGMAATQPMAMPQNSLLSGMAAAPTGQMAPQPAQAM